MLQHHKVVQVRAPPAGAVLTVHHVRLPAVTLTGDKEQVKHLHLGDEGEGQRETERETEREGERETERERASASKRERQRRG